MITLQSVEKYIQLAQYDHCTGNVRLISRGSLNASENINTSGIFSELSGVFVALYPFKEKLFLRIGERCMSCDDIKVFVSGESLCRKLIVEKAGEKISVEYRVNLSKKFDNDPTPFVEDEHFDFGLLVSNILNSNQRRQVFEESNNN
jgi:hypothetical protein